MLGEAYSEGSLLWYWYNGWIVVGAFAVVLLLGVNVFTVGDGPRKMRMAALVGLGLVMMVPVVLERVGLQLSIGDPDVVGYVSLGGAVLGLVVGLSSIKAGASRKTETAFEPGGGDTAVTGVLPEGAESGEEAGLAQTELVMEASGTPETPAAGRTQVLSGGAPPQGQGGTVVAQQGQGQPIGGTRIIPGMPGSAASAARPMYLEVKLPNGATRTLWLSEGVATIGRSGDNTYMLDDEYMSGRHLSVERTGDSIAVANLSQTNGSFVNGQRVEQSVLNPQDKVTIGRTELVLKVEEALGGTRIETAGASVPGGTEILRPPQEEALATLVVMEGPGRGNAYRLPGKAQRIGHAPDNDIVLPDETVSSHHAILLYQEAAFHLADLGSTNGTTVNGQPVQGRPFAVGQGLSLGRTEATLLEARGGGQAASQAGSTQLVRPEQSSGGYMLVVQAGPDQGRTLSLRRGRNVVGKGQQSDHQLRDTAVSDRHCVLVVNDKGVFVADLGSTNGTRIGGEPVRGHKLASGDAVGLGQTKLEFRSFGS